MKKQYTVDEWCVIEEQFDPALQEAAESIFSLGNGRMGQRANFEETYSGPSLQGSYVAGVYYPDKTRVGWWKNGYPEFFAKVLNAPNWIGIRVLVNGEELDLHTCKVNAFKRTLNMRHGFLERIFTVKMNNGIELDVHAKRFLSLVDDEIGAIRYSIKPTSGEAEITFVPYLDGNVTNRDSNYGEMFWDVIEAGASQGAAHLTSRTKKSGFIAAYAMRYALELDNTPLSETPEIVESPGYVGNSITKSVSRGSIFTLYKYAAVVSSLNYPEKAIRQAAEKGAERGFNRGFHELFREHMLKWENNWAHSDIVIKGDPEAQQGIRFNIFQLNQTYTGKDERLNIGPKGFTGEKYGGSTYWDTEAYLIPFYLSSAPPEVARNLLIYRYKHLQRAIENAELLGFKDGAALYPMVTMDGRECHNEWEITFEEIHRNGAIAYAIFNYIRYTGDKAYLAEYGVEVLIALSRFWRQRVNWSDVKGKYVILGVTGPNEYENNVNNNWYTNLMARWTLKYTMEAIEYVKTTFPDRYREIINNTGFDSMDEISGWQDVVEHMYFPYHKEKEVFLQQEGYMDKKQLFVSDLEPSERPINQHWSWDRILRSVFIKQADVLQGIYFFEEEYDEETIKRNFEFYESRTVHESSLSPCIHSILANRIGQKKKSYELYLRTSRLDLDDYNHEVKEGLHITSMGGTWMSVVYGFGGMRVRDDMLHFDPHLPDQWETLAFNIIFRQNYLKIQINGTSLEIYNDEGPELTVMIGSKAMSIPVEGKATVELEKGRVVSNIQ
jgi:maltose phosphorylase